MLPKHNKLTVGRLLMLCCKRNTRFNNGKLVVDAPRTIMMTNKPTWKDKPAPREGADDSAARFFAYDWPDIPVKLLQRCVRAGLLINKPYTYEWHISYKGYTLYLHRLRHKRHPRGRPLLSAYRQRKVRQAERKQFQARLSHKPPEPVQKPLHRRPKVRHRGYRRQVNNHAVREIVTDTYSDA